MLENLLCFVIYKSWHSGIYNDTALILIKLLLPTNQYGKDLLRLRIVVITGINAGLVVSDAFTISA